MESERVEEDIDASMIDVNDVAMDFPAIADQRPTRRFLGVNVPTDTVEPGFHQKKRRTMNGIRKGVRAVEVLGEEDGEDGKFVYAFFDDNAIRRIPATEFIRFNRGIMDNYIERKVDGTLLPFDYSDGPPYVHPDSQMQIPLKIRITRQQLETVSTSSGVNTQGDDDDTSTEDDDQSSEESRSSSEGYEEDEVPGARRSARTRAPKGHTRVSLHPSPRKTRSKGVLLSKKSHRPPPATSGSDDTDLSHSGSDSDSDESIVEHKATATGRPKRAPRQIQLAQPAGSRLRVPPPPGQGKPRTPRIPRPLLQSYGLVTSIDECDEFFDGADPLQVHHLACSVCQNPPTHEVIKKKKNQEWEKLGGWIRCMHCTEAFHWKCLNALEKNEILQAARARETDATAGDDSGSPAPLRHTIHVDETTEFTCTLCNVGGVCLECHRDLNVQLAAKDSDTGSPQASSTPKEQMTTELHFRCTSCKRAAHYAHLRSPWVEENAEQPSLIEEIATYYHEEYKWQCDDCSSYYAGVDKIIAWRPYPPNAPLLTPEQVVQKRIKDHWAREYLVKWEGKSYRRTSWVPHLWLVSMAYQKLRHFILNGTRVRLEHLRSGGIEGHTEDARRRVYEEEDGPPLPNPRAEECIPESWRRIEQVLDVLFWAPHKRVNAVKTKAAKKRGKVVHSSDSDEGSDSRQEEEKELKNLEALRDDTRKTGRLCLGENSTETPLARRRRTGGEPLKMSDIDDVVWCYAKWGELEYQEASWDTPPQRGDPEWSDFENAFRRYIEGQGLFIAKVSLAELKDRDNREESEFAKNRMEITQSYVAGSGPNLRPFQIEGVNWLTFQWWRLRSAILADEMGLGKTATVITSIAKLVEKKVWPHLILVPNSTILNWMREFQTWAPQVRAVPYYGDAASREIIRNYEIFQSGTTSGQTRLKLHVLVTTYDTFLTKVEWATVFKAPTRWETLVVDEGQRLKNNASLLFQRLNTINIGHRVLMTGTPLNNNLRELFNLMNFVDPVNWPDVEELEREYHQDVLTLAQVTELHEKLKPYFLRRTKEVLKLPHKHEIIVPVSLSKLQKGIYKSLIESNLTLLNTLISSGPKTKVSKTNLRNILMQSRKCVQHPYLVDNDLEPTAQSNEEMHRQLIDASGKLKFLEIALANLKARGRRVLLFSQFVIALDIIEDFIVGLGYKFLRLDGDLKASLRQKDIDKFNAPGSDYFIYLLSTRAGGVGINLATADTVIIFDPDFNPHQDAQAVARSHRFGQVNPVIVLRLMSITGPEKKIMHSGKKKLLLDHVIVQSMEEEEPAEDLETMLLSGAKGLFEGGEDNDIIYTEADVNMMIENAIKEASKPREEVTEASGLTFEFAQIWESSGPATNENEPEVDMDFWAKKMELAQKERERVAAQEVAESGRGVKRKARAAVTYQMDFEDSPQKTQPKSKKIVQEDNDYNEPGLDANTDATSDDEPYTVSLAFVHEELMELNHSAMGQQEALELKARIHREQRQRRKELMQEQQRLAAHHTAQAFAANQAMIEKLAAQGQGTISMTIPPAGQSQQLPASLSYNPFAPSTASQVPRTTYVPAKPSMSSNPRNTAQEAVISHETIEPVCKICETRHGLNACPAVRTINDLKALRLRLLQSNEPIEDKRRAIQFLDEDIAKREREQQSRMQSTTAFGSSGISTATTALQSNALTGMLTQQLAPSFRTVGNATTSSQNPTIVNATASGQNGGPSVGNSFMMRANGNKRPLDGAILNDRPTKKANIGSNSPSLCFLCNQPYHPVANCPIMNSDTTRMKRRLDQLVANANPAAESAVRALLLQYQTRLGQTAQTSTRFFNISD